MGEHRHAKTTLVSFVTMVHLYTLKHPNVFMRGHEIGTSESWPRRTSIGTGNGYCGGGWNLSKIISHSSPCQNSEDCLTQEVEGHRTQEGGTALLVGIQADGSQEAHLACQVAQMASEVSQTVGHHPLSI